MTERIHLPSQTAHTSPPARERVVRALMVVALSAGAAYLTWRLVATLNPEAMTLSVVLWSAEAWTFLTAALLFFAAWDPFHRAPPPPAPPGRTVDVFVPTLNEPVWVVRRALIGALAIDYPHRTWLLDDADRPEMRALADGLGVGYLPRPGNEGAKAPDVAPIRTLPDGRRGLLERFPGARVRLMVSEPRELGSRVRFTTWDDTEVQAGTVEAVRHVALPPYSTCELELSGLTAGGRRPPVSDVRMMGGPSRTRCEVSPRSTVAACESASPPRTVGSKPFVGRRRSWLHGGHRPGQGRGGRCVAPARRAVALPGALRAQLAGEPRQPVWLLTSPSDYPGHELAEWLHSVLALGALPGLDAVLFDGPLRSDEPTYLRVSRTLTRTARAGA